MLLPSCSYVHLQLLPYGPRDKPGVTASTVELRPCQIPAPLPHEPECALRQHFPQIVTPGLSRGPQAAYSALMKTYYVYILASGRRGTLYVGVTNDLVRRVYEHKTGAADSFTKCYGIKDLVWFEATPDVEEAIRSEKRIKRWRRSYKINVIEEHNPEWRDLYEELLG